MQDNVLYALIAAVIIIGGISIGAVYDQEISQSAKGPGNPGNSQPATVAPYSLTLVITTSNIYNSTVGDQPAFYVLNDGQLQSSANITLPSNTQIDLTIINYDDGPATTAQAYANVTGTTNNEMTIFNETNINSSYSGNGISVSGSQTVTHVPDSNIAHTFTVFSGTKEVVNLPITPSSTIQASFTLNSGSYTWQCEAACGSGNAGWNGAMSTPGWMTGAVYVSSSVPAQNYYSLTLLISTSNWFNNTVTDQPAYYVLDNGKLVSTENITLPAGKKIVATIVNYDDGPADTAATYANVTGTTNNQITIVNETNVNSSQGSNGIVVNGTAPVSNVPDTNIAHTFTLLSGASTVINIPVTPSSVIQTSFTLNSGSYTWQCEAACGSGNAGWNGAMSTPGWMTGTVFAQ
ncbi:MAG TPA: hypothetical protein VJ944_02080 [Thermoplasmataceae archaeon]|nr:hypothetical protein [Thermoplasmataceae archaeon]